MKFSEVLVRDAVALVLHGGSQWQVRLDNCLHESSRGPVAPPEHRRRSSLVPSNPQPMAGPDHPDVQLPALDLAPFERALVEVGGSRSQQ